MNESILLRRDERGVSLLTINRPKRLNTLDDATIDALLDTFDDIAADQAARVVVLTGAGDQAFSAGADIFGLVSRLAVGADAEIREFVEHSHRLTARIRAFPKPIIVAVNGIAYGSGCEIAEVAFWTIASDRARFAKSNVDLGAPPPFGGTQCLPRVIDSKHALRAIPTEEPISAATAAEVGLVNRVVPHDRLIVEALGLARRIISESAHRHCVPGGGDPRRQRFNR